MSPPAGPGADLRGMIGIGSIESIELIAREAAVARGTDQERFWNRVDGLLGD